MPYWASVLNQHFCLQVQKLNSKCCNGKKGGLAHTGENSSRAHVGTPCSTCDYESLCMSSLLSTWMALFLSQEGSPSSERKQPCTLDLCPTSLINQQKWFTQLPMISSKISRLQCIVSYWHDLDHMLVFEAVTVVWKQVQLPGTPAGCRFILPESGLETQWGVD